MMEYENRMNHDFSFSDAAENKTRAWRFILNEVLWNASGGTGKLFLDFLLLLGLGLLVCVILVAAVGYVHSLQVFTTDDIHVLAWVMFDMFFGLIDDRVNLSFMVLGYSGCALVHLRLKKVSIVVDARGIQFNGFLFMGIGKFYAWNEFVQIRRLSPYSHMGYDILIFVDCYGKSFSIRNGATDPKNGVFFVGDGHTLSLLEAIERFYPDPIALLDDAERRKIPVLRFWDVWNINIAGRAMHALMAALGVAVIGFFLHGIPFFLLENWKSHGLILVHWLAAGAGFALCWHYLKTLRQESWETAWIVSVLCGAALFFLSFSSAPLVPAWLGEARQEQFSVQKRNNTQQQVWRATHNFDSERDYLLFALDIPDGKRRYAPGAEKEFPLRCLFGLCAMSTDELDALRLSSSNE
jgi:hypothetical protein